MKEITIEQIKVYYDLLKPQESFDNFLFKFKQSTEARQLANVAWAHYRLMRDAQNAELRLLDFSNIKQAVLKREVIEKKYDVRKLEDELTLLECAAKKSEQ